MPLTVTTGTRQLSDGNPQGTILGQSATDPVGFYGLTAGVAQPSGSAQSALARGVACGSIATMATSQTPTSIGANTTIERGLTAYIGASTGTGMTWQLATGDVLMVSKPTAQAGLGVGNVRVSGTNVAAVSFTNWTAATVTPTAGEKYGIVAIRGLATLTAVLTPAAVLASTTAEQQFTVTGARAGEVVIVSKPTAQAGLEIVGARVVSNNLVGINFGTTAAASVTPTAGETYTVFTTGGIDSATNQVLVGANVGTLGGPAAASNVGSLAVTVTGLATSDNVMGISKPTAQAGSALCGGFVSGANALGVTFVGSTATVTPTGGEVYALTLFRPNPAAPCIVYSSVQTPAAVAPNTTAEQTFTVTGVISGSVVVVNKPSAQAGLGIVGARVSGTNVIAVNFCNATAATITPTAGEAYLVANFQQAIPDAGSAFVYTVSQQAYQNAVLSNAMRAAFASAGLNLIAGA